MAANWRSIGKKTMAPQFSDITLLLNFLMLFLTFFDVHLLVQVSRQILIHSGITSNFVYKRFTRNPEILVSFKVIFSNLAEEVLPQY